MDIPVGGEAFYYKESGERQSLFINDVSVASIADTYGTPFAFQIKKNISKLRKALKTINKEQEGISIYYALKANRFREVVDLIRSEGDIGIDVCSPAEVIFCKQSGFNSDEISYTGCFMSNKDLQILAKEGVHMNFDTLSAIRKYATLVPKNTAIGLRINTTCDMGVDSKLKYDDKFGFPIAQIPNVLNEIKELGLIVDTLHCHTGWNFPEGSVSIFEKSLAAVYGCAIMIGETLRVVDVGGGLGIRHHTSHPPSMTVSVWAHTIDRCLMQNLRASNKNVRVVCEPGTGIVANAGVLVAEVNTVETRGNITWVGLNAGSNINCYQSHYKLPLTMLSVAGEKRKDVPDTNNDWQRYNVAGNINESNDVFAVDVELPPTNDGDYIAMYPCGAYGSSMMSNHCMRGLDLKEVLIHSKNTVDIHVSR